MNESIAAKIAAHQRCIEALASQAPLLERMADAIGAALEAGAHVYLAGNGGSAADAQHIAAELIGRFKRDRRALPAVALTTDTSALTSIANDLGYDGVFARQIDGLVRPGDVVWLLSTSGRSPNILAAANAARARQALVIGFTGRDGDALRALCDHCLCVAHGDSDRIQETHQLAYHILCERIESRMADRS